MTNPKIIILVLVLIGVVAFMALGAGAYQDHQRQGNPSSSYTAGSGLKLLNGATGWMRSRLDSGRVTSACVSWPTINVATECYVSIGSGSRRPSGFSLTPVSGRIEMCFALSREKLDSCVARKGEPQLRGLDKEADFTVARDSAFLYFRCFPASPAGCVVRVN